MRFYKSVTEEYITGCGRGGIEIGTEITETEYTEIMSIIRNKPEETALIGYRLKTDLTWEQYEKEPEPEEEPTADEVLDILLGGESE